MLSNFFVPNHLTLNKSFNRYMNGIYSLVFNGFAFTFSLGCVLSYIYTFLPNIMMSLFIFSLPIFFGSVIMCVFNSKSDVIIIENEIIENINPTGLLYYWIHCCSGGVILSPIITLANETDPLIIPVSLGLTIGIFLSLSYYSLKYGSHNLLSLKSMLFNFLFGLFMIEFVRLFFVLSGTFYELNLGFDIVLSFGASVLFGGFILYDTKLIVSSFESRELNSLALVLNLYLDLINLFVRLVEIMIKTSKYFNKKK